MKTIGIHKPAEVWRIFQAALVVLSTAVVILDVEQFGDATPIAL